ncbi:Uncharacterised protein [Mycobacteroides abscessus subsp. massiliense]|nr:Uncharacterised protein [Mycobacteroides abscessus subsp. massiliense]
MNSFIIWGCLPKSCSNRSRSREGSAAFIEIGFFASLIVW